MVKEFLYRGLQKEELDNMSAVKNVIKDNYNMMLLKDYLRIAIKDAGFSHAEISKTPIGTRVVLHVTRPGIVIGRKGSGIRELTEKLATDFKLDL